MKLTIKSQGQDKVVDLSKDLQFNVSKGDQYIFSNGFTSYVLSFKDNQKSVELTFKVDGKTIKVELKGIVPFLQENIEGMQNPTLVIINKSLNEKEVDNIVSNDNFNGSEIIDRLEALLSQPVDLGSAGPNDKMAIISDFQSLVETLDAAAAGGEQGGNSNGSTFNSIFSSINDSLNGIADTDRWVNLTESISSIPVDTGNTIAQVEVEKILIVTPVDSKDPTVPIIPGNNQSTVNITTGDVRIPEGTDAIFKIDTTNPGLNDTTIKVSIGNGISKDPASVKEDLDLGKVEFYDQNGKKIPNEQIIVDGNGNYEVPLKTGDSVVYIKIPTFDDNIIEGDEDFKVNIIVDGKTATGTGIIVDNDETTVTITPFDPTTPGVPTIPGVNIIGNSIVNNNVKVPEGNDAIFTTDIKNPSSKEETVTVKLITGTADINNDLILNNVKFYGKDGSELVSVNKGNGEFDVKLPAGQTEFYTKVPTFNDLIVEGDENFTITATLDGKTATGTGIIVDNDETTVTITPFDPTTPGVPTIPGVNIIGNSIVNNNVKVPEGNDAIFTTDIKNPSSKEETVTVKLITGTADINNDLILNNVKFYGKDGSELVSVNKGNGEFDVKLPAGQTEFYTKVPTFNDLIVEGDENFTITATLDGKTATGTGIIVDNDETTVTITPFDPTTPGVPTIPGVNIIGNSIVNNNVKVPEGNDAIFTTDIKNPSSKEETVTVKLITGTADINNDLILNNVKFYGKDGSELVSVNKGNGEFDVKLPAGQTEFYTKVPTFNDLIVEGDENFTITATLDGKTATGTGIIVDNDETTVTITPFDPTTPGVPTIPGVNIIGNSIVNNNVKVPEGNDAIFTTDIKNPSSKEETVTVKLITGTADINNDLILNNVKFYGKDGSELVSVNKGNGEFDVKLPAGQTEFYTKVPTFNDLIVEGDENFTITATLDGKTATGTGIIVDNDETTVTITPFDPTTPGVPTIPGVNIIGNSIVNNNVKVPEGNDAIFTTDIKNPSSKEETVTVKLITGTADINNDLILNNVKFYGKDGSELVSVNKGNGEFDVKLPAGQTEFYTKVPTFNDLIVEGDENFTITATLDGKTATGTGIIVDNDETTVTITPFDPTTPGVPTIPGVNIIGNSIVNNNVKVPEGNDAIFTTDIKNPSSKEETVTVKLITGTADINNDLILNNVKFYGKDGSELVSVNKGNGEFDVKLPAGQTEFYTKVPTFNDLIVEGDENFTITATLDGKTATGTGIIVDNDETTVTITPFDPTTPGVPTIPGVNIIGNSIVNNNVKVPEGNDAIFTTDIKNPSSKEETVTVKLITGTADINNDLILNNVKFYGKDGSELVSVNKGNGEFDVKLPAGQTEFYTKVPTFNDLIVEGDENFTITATLDGKTATGTGIIVDNDETTVTITPFDPTTPGVPTIPGVNIIGNSIVNNNVKVPEGNDAIFTTDIKNPSSKEETVTVKLITGTADINNDLILNNVKFYGKDGSELVSVNKGNGEFDVKLPAGQTEFYTKVPTFNDLIVEGDENFTITATLDGKTATGTGIIVDNDETTVTITPFDPTTPGVPTIPGVNIIGNSIVNNNVKVPEGNDAIFTTDIKNPSSKEETVTVKLITGTADINNDLILNNVKFYGKDGSELVSVNKGNGEFDVKLPAGQTEFYTKVPTFNDLIVEGDENFTITATLDGKTATGTGIIVDNDETTVTITPFDPTTPGVPTIPGVNIIGNSIVNNNVKVPEGNDAIFTTDIKNPSSKEETVTVKLITGTADINNDLILNNVKFYGKDGSELVSVNKGNGEFDVKLPAGQTEFYTKVPTFNDLIVEGDENFTITATLDGKTATGTGIIVDNDETTVTITPFDPTTPGVPTIPGVNIIGNSIVNNNVKVPEGNDAIFTTDIKNPSSKEETVTVKLITGTADINNDLILNNVKFYGKDGSELVSVNKGNGEFDVKLPAGQTEFYTKVPTFNDLIVEGDENFTITATLDGKTATGTGIIVDNDETTVTITPFDPTTPGVPTIPGVNIIGNSIVNNNVKVPEGNDAIFTTDIKNPSSKEETVTVKLITGTADINNDLILNNVKFYGKDGSELVSVNKGNGEFDVKLPAGQTEFYTKVPTFNDLIVEGDENFTITATLDGKTATGTGIIVDNDETTVTITPFDPTTPGVPTIPGVNIIGNSIVNNNVKVPEGNDAIFTTDIKNPSSKEETVTVKLITGTADINNDLILNNVKFYGKDGSELVSVNKGNGEFDVKLPAGQTEFYTKVPTFNDLIVEGDENFTITATLDGKTATGTGIIVDNDETTVTITPFDPTTPGVPTIPGVNIIGNSIVNNNVKVPEGNDAIFTTDIKNPSSKEETVTVKLITGTADINNDLILNNVKFYGKDGSELVSVNKGNGEFDVKLPAGQTEFYTKVPTFNDLIVEGDENFTITATLDGKTATGTGIIVDNDETTVTITPFDPTTPGVPTIPGVNIIGNSIVNNNVKVPEGNDAIFTTDIKNPSSKEETVTVKLITGTADINNDLILNNVKFYGKDGSELVSVNKGNGEFDVKLPAGQTEFYTKVPTFNDLIVEGDENFTITATLDGKTATGTGIIVDNDETTVTITPFDPTTPGVPTIPGVNIIGNSIVNNNVKVPEGNDAIFTTDIKNPSSKEETVTVKLITGTADINNDLILNNVKFYGKDGSELVSVNKGNGEFDVKLPAGQTEFYTKVPTFNDLIVEGDENFTITATLDGKTATGTGIIVDNDETTVTITPFDPTTPGVPTIPGVNIIGNSIVNNNVKVPEGNDAIFTTDIKNPSSKEETVTVKLITGTADINNDLILNNVKFYGKDGSELVSVNKGNGEFDVKLPAGQTEFYTKVPTFNDLIVEGDENFTITATLDGKTATGTGIIVDNDETTVTITPFDPTTPGVPTIPGVNIIGNSIVNNNVKVPEGNDAIFTTDIKNPSSKEETVTVKLITGTADINNDLILNNVKFYGKDGSELVSVNKGNGEFDVKLPAGQTEFYTKVPTFNDLIVEGDENFTITATLDGKTATGTGIIVDNDETTVTITPFDPTTPGVPTIPGVNIIGNSIVNNNVKVPEGNDAIFTTDIKNPSSKEETVTVKLITGTADINNDLILNNVKFYGKDGSELVSVNKGNGEFDVKLPAGQTEFYTKVPTFNDLIVEGDENFTITATLDGKTATGTGIIVDNDETTVTITPFDPTTPGVPTIPGVNIIGNSIVNNNVKVPEGNDAIFTTDIKNPSSKEETVTVKLITGTADINNDLILNNVKFYGKDGSELVSVNKGNGEFDVKLPAGQTEFYTKVPTFNDLIVEGDENFTITATLDGKTATGTGIIVDNDETTVTITPFDPTTPGVPTIPGVNIIGNSIVNNNVKVPEGNDAIFTTDIKNPSSKEETVTVKLITGTADINNDLILNNVKFYGKDGSELVSVNKGNGEFDVKLPAGQTEFYTKVPTFNDLIVEGDENFTITATLDGKTATGTGIIVDNDETTVTITPFDPTTPGVPTIPGVNIIGNSIVNNNVKVPEGNDAIFTTDIKNPSSKEETVTVKLITGTADINNDLILNNVKFYGKDGSELVSVNKGNGEFDVKLPAGQTEFYTKVPTFNDLIVEGDENFTITATLDGKTATGTGIIVDNDETTVTITPFDPTTPGVPTIPGVNIIGNSIVNNNVKVPEGNDAIFTTDIKNPSSKEETVTVKLITGTADINNDLILNNVKFYGKDGSELVSVNKGNGEFDVKLPAGQTEFYTKVPTFNDLIVEGDENFTITATLDGKTATGTGIIVDKNLAPIVNDITVNVSEEGLKGGIKDNNGISDTTNETVATGKMIITDPNSDALNVVLVAPTNNLMAIDSNGNYANIIWSGTNTKELIGKVDNKEIIRVTIDNNGNYKVELLEPVKHPINSVEDIVSLDIGVKASDSELATVGKITVNIEDDMPIQCTISNEVEINIEKDLIIVKNLKAGFENAFFLNNTNTVNYVNNDNDAYNDRVDWGKSATGEQDRKSGYDLVDNKEYTTTLGSEVNPNGVFKLAQFTHENWALSSGESILQQATLVMNMDVVINGKVVNVSFDIVLGHNETPNDGADPRDIITLPSQNVFIKVDGEDYVFTIEGFKDINGNYVKKIYTEEQSDNVFDIYGSLKPVDSLLPKVIGNVCTEAGADGLDKVEWGDLNNPYGTMIVGANGGYVFTVNQATKDNLVVGKTLSQNFTYTITDKDGDTVTNSVTIKINGTSVPNEIPTTTDVTVITDEDISKTLSLLDFGTYNDADADSLSSIKIDTLPTNGVLTLSGVVIAIGTVISATDINAGKLIFTPNTNTDLDSTFTFQVSDGKEWSITHTTSIEITAVADVPTASINVTKIISSSNTDELIVKVGTTTYNISDILNNKGTYTEVKNVGNSTTSNAKNIIVNENLDSNDFLKTSSSDNIIVINGDISGGAKVEPMDGSDFVAILGNLINGTINDSSGIDTLYLGKSSSFYSWTVNTHSGDTGMDGTITQYADIAHTIIIGTLGINNIEGIIFADGKTIGSVETINNSSNTVEYKVDINAALTDTDGSETLTVQISGVPDGATFNSNILSPTSTEGVWELTIPSGDKSIVNTLTMTVPKGTLNFELGITAKATELSNNDSEIYTVSDKIAYGMDETNTLTFGKASTNLVVTLDVSGSMAESVTDSSSKSVTRFKIAIDSMIETIKAYKANGQTEVNLTLFGDGAKNIGWMSADGAIDYLSKLTLTSNSIKYNGTSISGLSTSGTDYDSALKSTMIVDFTGHKADNTIAYFLSDGAPTKNTTSTDSDNDKTIKDWKEYVTTNIDSLNVVGIGSGAKEAPLKIIQVQDGDKVIMATTDATLGNILLGTVSVTISGNATDNIFGGDGVIKIDSILVDGVEYTKTTFPGDGVALNTDGKLVFNFDTGIYSYSAKSSEFTTDTMKIFKVNASDIDGDITSFDVKIKVDITPNETVTTIKIPDNDSIDLTSLISNNYKNVTDVIDMTDGKTNTLKVEMKDVIDLVDADKELIIKGDLGDKVDLDKPSDWTNSGKEQLDGIDYNVYKGIGTNSTIKLLIDDDIDVIL